MAQQRELRARCAHQTVPLGCRRRRRALGQSRASVAREAWMAGRGERLRSELQVKEALWVARRAYHLLRTSTTVCYSLVETTSA